MLWNNNKKEKHKKQPPVYSEDSAFKWTSNKNASSLQKNSRSWKKKKEENADAIFHGSLRAHEDWGSYKL